MTLAVATAVTGAWEGALVAGLEAGPHQVRVVRRCADLAEVLAVAGAGLARAVLLSADLERLDREAVARLAHARVAVVAVVEPGCAEAVTRLAAIGIDTHLPRDSAPEEVARTVGEAVARLDQQDPAEADPASAVARHEVADPADALPASGGAGTPDGRAVGGAPRGTGQVIAVWGPTGAPGRTTVAVNLASELVARGLPALLVDADTYGPSVAQALGLLDESAGLAAAARSATQGRLDAAELARTAVEVSPGLRVLTGLSLISRWPELRASALEAVWASCRELCPWTVIDCGFGLEADEELSYDTTAPRRNGATLSALAAADLVVAVGTADPIGLQRLIRGLRELAESCPERSGPPQVVVTRVRAATAGPDPVRQVREALTRFAGVADAVLVPDDRAACDRALLAGRTLAESAPDSPARVALSALAARVSGADPRRQAEAVGRPARRFRRSRHALRRPRPAADSASG